MKTGHSGAGRHPLTRRLVEVMANEGIKLSDKVDRGPRPVIAREDRCVAVGPDGFEPTTKGL